MRLAEKSVIVAASGNSLTYFAGLGWIRDNSRGQIEILSYNQFKHHVLGPDLSMILFLILSLKGLSTLKLTCSGFKDYGLLILPLTLIFHFGETPESGRDSGQKMSNPVTKSY